MTSSRPARPGVASSRALQRPARRSGVLALALAATTSVAALGAVPVAGTTSGPDLSRVLVSAVGTGADGAAAAAAAVAAAGGTVLDHLPLLGGVSADLPAGAVLAPGLTVVADRPVQLAGEAGTDAGPASTVRETLGLGAPAGEGAGTLIAVVDTGVADHPDLAGRLSAVDVSGAGTGDGYGHGTFVAGIAAGSGASSGGRYAGVAPGADVLDVRVADDEGSTDLVTVLRGLQVAHDRGADVVNLSLSSYSPLPWQLDPLTQALTTMWAQGTVVVVPAGNDGPDQGTVTSPGVAPALLTVGTLDESGTGTRGDDVVASFSGRGPAPQDVAKPELAAPGRSVVSLRAAGSLIDTEHSTGRVGDSYFTGSGTSFSTAVAAGAAATLRAERALEPDQVKALLTGTAYPVAGGVDAVGAGGLDLAAARTAATPEVPAGTAPCRPTGKGKKACEVSVPGGPGEWQPLLRALTRGDAEAAASSWSRLSPAAQAWVASSWSSLPADLRTELTAEWTARNWADAEQWAARNWAARNWAASSWSARNWAARNWAASSWSGADGWLHEWDARNWAARNWAARNWAASSWSARNWAARNWAARNWAASSWSARNWAARNWAENSWAARNWAAVEWGP